MANDTIYGLAAYFHTRDYARLLRVAEQLEYGIVGANDGIISSAASARSAASRSRATAARAAPSGIDEYLDVKYVSIGGVGLALDAFPASPASEKTTAPGSPRRVGRRIRGERGRGRSSPYVGASQLAAGRGCRPAGRSAGGGSRHPIGGGGPGKRELRRAGGVGLASVCCASSESRTRARRTTGRPGRASSVSSSPSARNSPLSVSTVGEMRSHSMREIADCAV